MYSIAARFVVHERFSRGVQLAALHPCLRDADIDAVCHRLGHRWRRRELPPAATVRSIIYRGLHPDKSIAAVLADLAAAGVGWRAEPTDSAWCQARSRLPEGLWPALIDDSDQQAQSAAGRAEFFHGRPVDILDGSTVSMPDERVLAERFGYANTKHGFSRFPVARVTFVLRAGAETVRQYRLGPYTDDENHHLWAMSDRMERGTILLFDRHLSSFYNLATLSRRGVDVVTRLHHRRDPQKLIARGRRLGRDEWLVTFELAEPQWRAYGDPELPHRLRVRLIRVSFLHNGKRHRLWLVTTLLNSRRYRRTEVVALYRRRWGIETRIGTLKTLLAMRVLRSKTERGVRTEVAGRILAYNLVWVLIHQAARQTDVPADRISFADAVRTILAFSQVLRWMDDPMADVLSARMLNRIGAGTNRDRPGRIEPRLIKRDTRRYGFLKEPRDLARLKA